MSAEPEGQTFIATLKGQKKLSQFRQLASTAHSYFLSCFQDRKIKSEYDKSKSLEYLVKAHMKVLEVDKAVEVRQSALIPFMKEFVQDETNTSQISKLSEDEAAIFGRLIYVRTIVDSSLLHRNSWDNIKAIKVLQKRFPDSLKINKYYVKCLLQGESRQSLNDSRVSYLEFLEAEKVNEQVLNGRYKYSKLNFMLLMRKIQFFQSFIKPDEYEQLKSKAMREIGTKSKWTPNLMREFAEFFQRKGDMDKALEYINRAEAIAEQVLGSAAVHRKFTSIKKTKVDILVKRHEDSQALEELDRYMALVEALAEGRDNDLYRSNTLWVGTVLAEIKEKKQEAEEALKAAEVWVGEVAQRIEAKGGKGEYLFRMGFSCEIMAIFIKIGETEQAVKIYNGIMSEAAAINLQHSFALVMAEYIYAQAMEDPQEMMEVIDRSLSRSMEIDQHNKEHSTVQGLTESAFTLMFQCFMCSLTLAMNEPTEVAKTCQIAIDKIVKYYEGNEYNDLIVEPLIILASIQQQGQQLKQAEVTGLRAEKIVREMNGESSEKIIEVYQMNQNLMMMKQDLQGALGYALRKTTSAELLHGQQSEQYCQHLEEQLNLMLKQEQNQEALPLAEKLVRLQVEENAGEGNAKVLAAYELAFTAQLMTKNFRSAYTSIGKQLGIYKTLTPGWEKDPQTASYEVKMAFVQCLLGQYEEGFKQFDQVKAKLQKMDPHDPVVKTTMDDLLTLKEQMLEKKMAQEALATQQTTEDLLEKKESKAASKKGESFLDYIKPNTPAKIALWSAAIAAVAVTAVVVLKKK